MLGSARSGKSAWAESVVIHFPPPYVYVATAQALDDEMKLRIGCTGSAAKTCGRQSNRRSIFRTVLKSLKGLRKPVLVDCITLWLSNLLCSASIETESAVDGLCEAIEAVDYPLVIVSNEVGGGIVPDNPLARKFRDLSGLTNQRLARICASVFLVTAGLPLRLK